MKEKCNPLMIITSFNDLNKITSFWPSDNDVDTPFQTYDWQKVWVKHFSDHSNLKILVIEKKARPLAIMPLHQNQNLVEFLGIPPNISDYQDALFFTKDNILCTEIIQQTLQFLKNEMKISTAIFSHLRETSPLYKNLYSQAEKEKENVPILTLPPSWDEYLLKLTRKNRHELKRKSHRLETQNIQFLHLKNSKEIEKYFPHFIVLMKKSSDRKNLFMDKAMSKFFFEMAQTFASKNMLLLSMLLLNHIPIATTLCFDFKKCLYLYNSGYDPQYQKFSPGLLLKAETIRYAIEQGFDQYDFLRGDEKYKFDLGASDSNLYTLAVKL